MNKLHTFYDNLETDILIPIFKQAEIGPVPILPVPGARFFLCLFRAAVAKSTYFLLDGILNLYTPLNAHLIAARIRVKPIQVSNGGTSRVFGTSIQSLKMPTDFQNKSLPAVSFTKLCQQH
jgi:hypothetical protein